MIALSVIVPTFNEISNVRELHRRISLSCAGSAWEMIFVDDDSPDGTSAEVCALASEDSRVRIVHRIGRRGLTSACLEGMMASSASVVAVIDADLQHDEALLPKMFEMLSADATLDIVVGSRYTDQGSIGNWSASRAFISRFATRLGSLVLKADLKDPMSGFFMIRRNRAIECIRNGMSGIGFKILLDLFASAPTPLRFKEIPFEFRNRFSGQSKLDTSVVWEYLIVLVGHLIGGIVPVRFIAFSIVGGLGVLIHLTAFSALFNLAGASFVNSQIAATLFAMTCNFILNNILTYRDMRLRGMQLISGWISFALACSLGAIANVSLSQWIFEEKPSHWILAVLPGILVAAVWNYAVTSVYTWKKPRIS